MAWIFLILFVGVPLMELSVLIEVGSDIGALATVALCLLTAAVGLSLIRMQGLKVIADIQQASQAGGPVVEPLVHGFFLLISGVCLFFPGFVTDAVGALLLIPPIRLALGRAGIASAAARGSQSFYHSRQGDKSTTIIVDGEYWESREESDRPVKTIEGANDEEKS